MLVSSIMPTANRRRFVPGAIAQFLAQDYPNKELIVLDDGDDSVADIIPSHPAIRYLRTPRHGSLGAKRNAANEAAGGEILLHWDDDDWYAPNRIRLQVEALLESGADICGTNRPLFVDLRSSTGWEYVYPSGGVPWVCGATMCYRREFWRDHPFADVRVGEDTRFAAVVQRDRLYVLPNNRFFVGLIHASNSSKKVIQDARWHQRAFNEIRAITGPDWPSGQSNGHAMGNGHAADDSAVLVTAASGIGDILRISPLIRVLHGLGHAVDVLIAPDNPEVADLLRGAPEIRELFVTTDTTNHRRAVAPAEMRGRSYSLATFTRWSAPLAHVVESKRALHFQPEAWLAEGDYACVESIARDLGWSGVLPEPFALSSDRDFGLAPGTITLHPGCKPEWPWKKWHGFEDLSRRFAHVEVVGTDADLDNAGSYFAKPFEWPNHVRSWVGKLRLADTAALIRQSAAFVSNDSGLMHLSVALGVPTFGIFGITNPVREAIPSPKMTAISKDLPCEPACRRQGWGRRDCEHHLACLKTLSAEEVAVRIADRLPDLPIMPPSGAVLSQAEPIRVVYYGEVFAASGYGAAARAYIHAMHDVGIKLSVVDTGARHVEDPLVASLVGKDPDAHFHLFHGIPPWWARQAYPLRNVIAMTVWETDTMPPPWRNPLTHAIDVWLPCRFNVDVFSRALGRQPFRLPHPVPQRQKLNGKAFDFKSLGVAPGDFVFYACFEWQDRKNPRGTILAFLRAFPADGDAVLLLKANPQAASAADSAVRELSAETGVRGRIVLCCEAWDDARIEALHSRGDCYVSLHKGEGWGYPLFEAACRGKPVIATAYSGPLDYLDEEHHWLVRHQNVAVRQPYAFYHPNMSWSEPDISHAAEGLRWVYEHRAEARERASVAAKRLVKTFDPREVGLAAKARLTQLLTDASYSPRTTVALGSSNGSHASLIPPQPIPAAWYDRDYFETGRKSNWNKGYTWPEFRGVFADAASFLQELFPDARSFLDVGCAKGFLVRALRERGLDAWGFDHSEWALARCEAEARPFVSAGDVGTIDFDRKFDVTIAMSVFESLTESQLLDFLPRARSWTQQGLFAIVTMPSSPNAASARGDLSQITLRGRDWWLDSLRRAGWQQDALHRNLERIACKHAVAARMGWHILLLSPGQES